MASSASVMTEMAATLGKGASKCERAGEMCSKESAQELVKLLANVGRLCSKEWMVVKAFFSNPGGMFRMVLVILRSCRLILFWTLDNHSLCLFPDDAQLNKYFSG